MQNDKETPELGTTVGPRGFVTTHWSVVLAARDGDPDRGAISMEKLCRDYWPPLYSYIRREGYSSEDAQDLTQEFFAQLLEKDWLRHLHDQRGKFRSFLLTLLKHFLSDQRDHAKAQKRGGKYRFIALDEFEVEEREHFEPVDSMTPDLAFDRRWLQRLNQKAVERLRLEYAQAGKSELFEVFKSVQRGGQDSESQTEIGRRLGMSTSAVKSALHRFHMRQSEYLREEVLQTVSNPSSVTEELRDLLRAQSV